MVKVVPGFLSSGSLRRRNVGVNDSSYSSLVKSPTLKENIAQFSVRNQIFDVDPLNRFSFEFLSNSFRNYVKTSNSTLLSVKTIGLKSGSTQSRS